MSVAGQVQWGDIATWVASLGTVGALAAALWQIGSERRRRHSDEHRAQARLISVWVGERKPPESYADDPDASWYPKGRTTIYVANNSSEPVYFPVVGIVDIQGTGPHTMEKMLDFYKGGGPITTISILPPGRYRVWIRGIHWQIPMGGRQGAEIAFTDSAGVHWIRRSTGALDELRQSPLDYLKKWQFFGPHDFQPPQRLPDVDREPS